MIHAAVYRLKYQHNDTSIPVADIYHRAIVVSAVSLQAIDRMPLWPICISFVLHKGEQFESELKMEAERK